MKVILSIFILSVTAFAATAQNRSLPTPTGKAVTVMTVTEANALNGTAQPTINGIPYSEYKAQQEALKAKPAVQNQQGLKLIQSSTEADLAAGRKNEPAPIVAAVQKTSATEQPVAVPASKPVLGLGVPSATKTQP